MEKRKTAGDVYCTADVGTTEKEGWGRVNKDLKGDRQTDRMKETGRDHGKLSDENSLWEGCNPKE